MYLKTWYCKHSLLKQSRNLAESDKNSIMHNVIEDHIRRNAYKIVLNLKQLYFLVP